MGRMCGRATRRRPKSESKSASRVPFGGRGCPRNSNGGRYVELVELMADGTTVGNSSSKHTLFKHHLMEFLSGFSGADWIGILRLHPQRGPLGLMIHHPEKPRGITWII